MKMQLSCATPDGLIEQFSRRRGRFSKGMNEIYVLLWLGGERYAGVAGDGDNGTYENFTYNELNQSLDCSDCGWGSVPGALREVLNRVDA